MTACSSTGSGSATAIRSAGPGARRSARRRRSPPTSGSRWRASRPAATTSSSSPERLGFGAPIPFDLPTAASQVTNGRGDDPGGFVDDVELANAAYGQGETFVTPLQMALVAATVANDGVLMKPRLVTALEGKRGTREIGPEELGRVISPDDAQAIQRGDAAGGRRRPRPAVHERREGPGHPDGRQVRHGRARWDGRAALVVHRLRAGRTSRGSRSPSSWSTPAAAAQSPARSPAS